MTDEKKTFVTKAEILEKLGISVSYLEKICAAGAPSFVRGKGYPLAGICRWIVSQPRQRKGQTQAREKAARILAEISPPVANTPRKKPAAAGAGELGIEAALARIKNVEAMLHGRLIETIDGGGFDVSAKLKEWQDSLDVLRKMEGDALKVLEEKKRLINVDAVKTWLDRKIETTKAFLLNVPGKVAPGLDGLPWHEIQKRLEVEVRNALSKLSTDDLS